MGALSGVTSAALVIDEARCRVRKGPTFRVADTRSADLNASEYPPRVLRTGPGVSLRKLAENPARSRSGGHS